MIIKKVDTLILGAGASGLLYGFLNKQGGNQNFLILEKESSPFGLMKSFPL
jgi:cation diffusion facilitator CzcD-associated flavoprotein CzcO